MVLAAGIFLMQGVSSWAAPPACKEPGARIWSRERAHYLSVPAAGRSGSSSQDAGIGKYQMETL